MALLATNASAAQKCCSDPVPTSSQQDYRYCRSRALRLVAVLYDNDVLSLASVVSPNQLLVMVVLHRHCSSQVPLMKEMFDSIELSGVRPCLPSFQSEMESDVYIRQKVYAVIVLSNGASIF